MDRQKEFRWTFPDTEILYKYQTLTINDLIKLPDNRKWRNILNYTGCEAERKANREVRLIIKDLLKMIGDDIVDNSYEVILPRRIGSIKVKDINEIDTKINNHLYKFDINLMGAYPDLFFMIDQILDNSVQYFDPNKNYVGHLTYKLRKRAIENMLNGYKYP